MREYFSARDTDVKKFIYEQNTNSRFNYYGFLDDFLFKYGISSFNIIPHLDNDFYYAYIIFKSHNVFNEKKGELSVGKNLKNLTVAEEQLANKLINLIHFTRLEQWLNFKEE